MNSLKALGVDIESVARQGYRLPRAVDLLDKEAIVASLPAATRSQLERGRCAADRRLNESLRRGSAAAASRSLFSCVPLKCRTLAAARRGRSWVAPCGSGVCMSLGWQFTEAPPTFSALSLAVGVAVVKAFRRLGIEGVGLKWPNDLQWQGRKLGGILIEMRGESAGPAQVIIGIGVNMQMPAAIRMQLAEREAALIADIHEIMREKNSHPERVDQRHRHRAADDVADVHRSAASRRSKMNGTSWTRLRMPQ